MCLHVFCCVFGERYVSACGVCVCERSVCVLVCVLVCVCVFGGVSAVIGELSL